MKQANMNPCKIAWRRGRSVRVGAWSFHDETWSHWDAAFGRTVVGAARRIDHYGTTMGFFMADCAATPIWRWEPTSVGWGSVSDQQGCNRIVAGLGGWYFQRAGGSKWVQR